MCEFCWTDAGTPRIVNAKTLSAASAVEELYAMPAGIVGGHLHVVLDDWNVEDAHIDACERDIVADEHGLLAWQTNDDYREPAFTALERTLIAQLRAMTYDERVAALALAEGFIERPQDGEER